jgi:hypothetical protein
MRKTKGAVSQAPKLENILLEIGIFVCLGVGLLRAQGTAYISGYVLDKSGAGVPNAKVVVTNQATTETLTLVTNSVGLYRTPPLLPGTYQITVTASGFQQLVRKGVVVTLGQPLGLNLTLSVGAITQQVQVASAPPLLRTQDSGLGQNVSYKAVAVLPMFNRDAGELIALSPTVRYFGEDHISYGSSRFDGAGIGNPQYYYNGAPIGGDRTDVGQMTYDPPVESIGEARVIQNQYSAQYGSNVGQIVMFQSKQGTNQFHGSVYEYFRNGALDSYNGFTDTKPADRQNIPGFTFGGPLKRDKAFFFTNLEIQRQSNPEGAVFTVPTQAMRSGDFSALGIPIYDPTTTHVDPSTGKLTRNQFPGNMIPSSEFDPVALNALKYEPLPNQPGVSGNLLASGGNTADKNRLVGAFDYDINSKNTFHADYLLDLTTVADNGWAPWNAINPHASPSGEALGFTFKTQVFNFQETHTFSPKFMTTEQFSYRPRYILRQGAQIDPKDKWAETLGLKGWAGSLLPPSYGGDLGFPNFNFSGYEGLGTPDLQFAEYPINEYDYAQDFTYIKGKHSIGFGAGLERNEHGAANQSIPTGQYNFGPLETGLPRVEGTGDAFASFLLGLTDNANTALGPREIWHEWYYYTWIEDDMKVTPKLTLNLGFRWDIDAPVYEAHNFGNGFNFYGLNPVSGTLGVVTFFGQNGIGDSFYNTDYHRFAPRFGFAYEFAPNWVLRGGYGIYNISPTLGANRRAPDLGFTTAASFSSPDGGVTPAFLLRNGFPSYPLGGNRALLTSGFGAAPPGVAPSTSPTFVDPNWKFGYSQNFNLSIQHQLPWDSMVEVAGQGVRGLALPIFVNWNEVPPQFWGISGPNFGRRPFPQFNSVTQVQAASGYSNYYAGTVRFEKRFSHGFNIIANYAYQKSLGFMGGSIYFPNLNYGPTLFDQANMPTGQAYQTGAIEGTYYLPAGPGQRYFTTGPLSEMLGGWYVSGIFTRQSGEPFDVGSGIDSLNGNSPLGGRANRIPGIDPYAPNKSVNAWLNPAAFTAPTFGQIGNDCCGTLFGPAQTEFNIALGKDFRLTERFGLRFSAECFNCTNTLQWGLPDANLSSPGFGRIFGPLSEGANSDKPEVGQRIMQLGLKLTF